MKKQERLVDIAAKGLLMALSFSLPAGVEGKSATREVIDPDPFVAMKGIDGAKGNLGYKLMTEEELLIELNDEGVVTYNSLDTDGKDLARFVASTMCAGTNACKGLGACQDDKHDCAGQNECKGQGKCGMSDKNLAVKLVAKRMAEKRAQALAPSKQESKPQAKTQNKHK